MVYSREDGWLLNGSAVADPVVDMDMTLYRNPLLLVTRQNMVVRKLMAL